MFSYGFWNYKLKNLQNEHSISEEIMDALKIFI